MKANPHSASPRGAPVPLGATHHAANCPFYTAHVKRSRRQATARSRQPTIQVAVAQLADADDDPAQVKEDEWQVLHQTIATTKKSGDQH